MRTYVERASCADNYGREEWSTESITIKLCGAAKLDAPIWRKSSHPQFDAISCDPCDTASTSSDWTPFSNGARRIERIGGG